VHAKHRRRGVARALMREVHKNMALEVDCAKLHVRCSNAQALQLYAGLGYDVVDVVQSYYHDGEAAYLMQADVKKLAAADAAEDSASEEAVLAA
jgi:ribosomal-protein-alanine N-acetyltransferase